MIKHVSVLDLQPGDVIEYHWYSDQTKHSRTITNIRRVSPNDVVMDYMVNGQKQSAHFGAQYIASLVVPDPKPYQTFAGHLKPGDVYQWSSFYIDKSDEWRVVTSVIMPPSLHKKAVCIVNYTYNGVEDHQVMGINDLVKVNA